jgi:DNA-binding NarL/FixJ family response regulator
MKILLWSDDLMSRVRIESRWKAAGAQLLRRDAAETPDLIVVDLTARDAAGHIRRFRGQFPSVDILAFGPHVDADGFRDAKAAGASECVARGAAVERVLARLGRGG